MQDRNRSYRPNPHGAGIPKAPQQQGKNLIVFSDDEPDSGDKAVRTEQQADLPERKPSLVAWAVLGGIVPLVGMIAIILLGTGQEEGEFREKLKWMVFGLVGVMAVALVAYMVFLVVSGTTVDGGVTI